MQGIPLLTCQKQRIRIWILERRIHHLNRLNRKDLGRWLRRRRGKHVQEKLDDAVRRIRGSQLSELELRKLWMEQKQHQLNLPTRKSFLDTTQ